MFWASAFLSLVLSLPAPVQQIQKTFSKHQGFRVKFHQFIKQDVIRSSSTEATGYVEFHRPHRLEWVYQKPRSRTLSYDGKNLYMDEGGGKELIEDAGKISLQESLGFLWGEMNPQNFKIESESASSFRLIPKNDKRAGFKFIDVSVSHGLVTRAQIHDHLDGVSTLEFQDWKFL